MNKLLFGAFLLTSASSFAGDYVNEKIQIFAKVKSNKYMSNKGFFNKAQQSVLGELSVSKGYNDYVASIIRPGLDLNESLNLSPFVSENNVIIEFDTAKCASKERDYSLPFYQDKGSGAIKWDGSFVNTNCKKMKITSSDNSLVNFYKVKKDNSRKYYQRYFADTPFLTVKYSEVRGVDDLETMQNALELIPHNENN